MLQVSFGGGVEGRLGWRGQRSGVLEALGDPLPLSHDGAHQEVNSFGGERGKKKKKKMPTEKPGAAHLQVYSIHTHTHALAHAHTHAHTVITAKCTSKESSGASCVFSDLPSLLKAPGAGPNLRGGAALHEGMQEHKDTCVLKALGLQVRGQKELSRFHMPQKSKRVQG